VWVNRGLDDWALNGRTLPQYGFYARVPVDHDVVEAAIERRDGVITDWAKSASSWFVNGRPVISDRLPVKVSVESASINESRQLQVKLLWQASEPLKETWRVLVHFVDKTGNIAFQADYDPTPPTTQWNGPILVGIHAPIPSRFENGESFDLRVGFYNPGGGPRGLIDGPLDPQRRVRLGTFRVSGGKASFTAYDPGPDPLLARLNPAAKMVGFGGVATNAAVKLSRVGDRLWITPLPDSRASQVRLKWEDLPWKQVRPHVLHVRNEDGSIASTRALTEENGEIVIDVEPGVFAYELP
jgi:hypothetical protein